MKTHTHTHTHTLYLEGACFEQHDLVMLAESLEARDALGKLHHLSDSWGEALGEGLPHLLAGAPRRGHRARIQGTRLGHRK